MNTSPTFLPASPHPPAQNLARTSPPLFFISSLLFVLAIYSSFPGMANPYYLGGGIFFLYLAYFRQIASLYVLLLLLPFTTLSLWVGSNFIFIGEVLFGVLFLAWLAQNVFLGKQPFQTIPNGALSFIFIFLSLVSTWGSSGTVINEIFQTMGIFLWAPLLCMNLVKDEKGLSNAMTAIMVSGIVAAIFGILEHYAVGGRIKGFLGEPNNAAAYFLMSMAFVLGRLLNEPRLLQRILLIAACVMISSAVIWTNSRAGMVGGLALLVAVAFQRGPTLFVPFLVAAGVGYYFLPDIISPEVIERFMSITDTSTENLGARDFQYRTALIVMEREPLLGAGPGNLLNYTLQHRDAQLTNWVGLVHNIFLHIGAERGVPALTCFIFIYLNLLINTTRGISTASSRILRQAYFSCFGFFFVFLVVNQSAYFLYKGTGLLFGLSMGLVGVANRLAAEQQDEALRQHEEAMKEDASQPAPVLFPL